MSEERMLRLSEHEFGILSNFWSAARKERFHEDERPTLYEHQTVVIPLERRIYEGFQKLEPAPPKGYPMRSVEEIMERLRALFDYAVELGECTPEGIEEFRTWLSSHNTQNDVKER